MIMADFIAGAHTLSDLSLAAYVQAKRQAVAEGRPGNHARDLAAARGQQMSRVRLRMRYRAMSEGTNSYDRYHRFGDAPSYGLAALMDRTNWQNGRPHVLDWDAGPAVRRRNRPLQEQSKVGP